jgi:PAS domain S-box-containing protein
MDLTLNNSGSAAPVIKNDRDRLRTIVVVEDDEGLSRLIIKSLKAEGFAIHGISKGSQAIKAAADNPDAILLLDFFLHDMTAEDIILALKNKRIKVPFIILTGQGDEQIAIKMMKLGAKDYIKKEEGFLELLPTVIRRVIKELNTEEKLFQAQNALKESEEKYRSIFDNAANLITSSDKKGIVVDCNSRITQMLGYEPHEIIGQSILKIIHPDYEEKLLKCLEKITSRNDTNNQEFIMVRKDGIPIDVNINPAVLMNDKGKCISTVCIVNDITEQKRIGKELEWELTVNTALADLSNALVISAFSIKDIANIVLDYAKLITTSRHGYISSVDPLSGSSISYGLTQMFEDNNLNFNKNDKVFFSKEADGQYHGLRGHTLNTGAAFYTNSPSTHTSSRGTPEGHVPINNFLSVPSMFGEKVVGLIALANSDRDYTELDMKVIERLADLYAIAIQRKQMEEKLRKSEASLEEAQRIAKIGNYIWNSDKDQLTWSQGTFLIFGLKPGEFEPSFQKFIDFIHPEDKRRVTEIIKEAIIKKTGYDVEYRIVLKDKTERMLRDEGEVRCDEHNKPVRIFGVIQDITERKNFEKALFDVEERERQRIGYELHDGLGQLLTGISFKNRGLERKLEKSSCREADDATEISILIDEAKEQVSRLSKGLSPVEMDKEGLRAALEALASHNNKIFRIPCTFTCDKSVSVHNEAAITQLYRIAQEAVTNAVKHGKPDRIDIFLEKRNDEISLEIKDDGIGIAKEPKQAQGMGLKIMRYRASIINASLDFKRNITGGTLVTCTFSDTSGGLSSDDPTKL